jgi:hypothetical protein
MIEVYLETLYDVIWTYEAKQRRLENKKAPHEERPEIKPVMDYPKKGMLTIQNVREVEFTDSKTMIEFMQTVETHRHVRSTGLNDVSSRSHLVTGIKMVVKNKQTKKTTRGKLSLCDLAGSERVERTLAGLPPDMPQEEIEMMKEEGLKINYSLGILRNCFRILGGSDEAESDKLMAAQAKKEGKEHKKKKKKKMLLPYRDSKLTMLMQDSLGGKARTLMFVNVSPADDSVNESVDSLRYGLLVNNITNQVAGADEDFEEQIQELTLLLEKYRKQFGEI